MARKSAEIKVEMPAKDRIEEPLPAYFLSLTVENVRCFGPEQTLDLSNGRGRPVQWTIILGDNGVGKTTLLRVFAAVTPSFYRSRSDGTTYYVPRYTTDKRMQAEWNLKIHTADSSYLFAEYLTNLRLTEV